MSVLAPAQVYIGDTEIEAEPDNDSDDTNFPPTFIYTPFSTEPGALPVIQQSSPSSHLFNVLTQSILNVFQAAYSFALSSSATQDSAGNVDQIIKNPSGTIINEVHLNADGSTSDVRTFSDGGYADVTSAILSDTPNSTSLHAQYTAQDLNTGTYVRNPDGTTSMNAWAHNADGSETFFITAQTANTGSYVARTTTPAVTPATVNAAATDSYDYAAGQVAQWLDEGAKGSDLKSSAGSFPALYDGLQTFSTSNQATALNQQLYADYASGKDVSVTATELASKVGITSMASAGVPFNDTTDKTSTALGNIYVGALIDSFFVLQQNKGQISGVDAALRHSPLKDPSGTSVLPDLAATALTVAAASPQATIYTWQGLDTAGFATVAWAGVGVQDITLNLTSTVAAASSGGASPKYSYTNGTGHKLGVFIYGSGMAVSTGSGDDKFYANAANDSIDGGGGGNTVVFQGNRADYRLSTANGVITVIDQNTVRNGIDTLSNIKTIQFADTTADASSVTIITKPTLGVVRFFDKNNGTHFFSTDPGEVANIVNTRPDLALEGNGFHSADQTNNDPANAAVFRFFDSKYGTHFYTASATERDGVIQTRSDLIYEGTGFYEHVTGQPGDIPVYRFFDSNYGTHFYTSDANERATILATRTDLKDEGIGFYAPSY